METLGNTKVVKSRKQKYHCVQCHYITSRKLDFDKHLATDKHFKLTNASVGKHECTCGKTFNHKQSLFRHKKVCDGSNNPKAKVVEVVKCFQMFPDEQIRHACACGATYSSRSGLWKHKKTCLHGVGPTVAPTGDNTEVLAALHKLQSKMDSAEEEMKSIKSGVMTAVAEPKVVNNYNNINVFLNERCSDAMPIQDFVRSLVIGIEDVNYVLENGQASGIVNIIEKKMDDQGVYRRPLHCTDVKRGTMYVKNAEGWDKEKGEMAKLIQDVNQAQVKGIKLWEAEHPNCFEEGHEKERDKWLKIVKCLTNSLEGTAQKKITRRCCEVTKINQDEMV